MPPSLPDRQPLAPPPNLPERSIQYNQPPPLPHHPSQNQPPIPYKSDSVPSLPVRTEYVPPNRNNSAPPPLPKITQNQPPNNYQPSYAFPEQPHQSLPLPTDSQLLALFDDLEKEFENMSPRQNAPPLPEKDK